MSTAAPQYGERTLAESLAILESVPADLSKVNLDLKGKDSHEQDVLYALAVTARERLIPIRRLLAQRNAAALEVGRLAVAHAGDVFQRGARVLGRAPHVRPSLM